MTEKTPQKLSRRTFLKIFGLGFAGAAAETYLGPINKVLEYFGSLGEEGNTAQRAAKLESIMRLPNTKDGLKGELINAFIGFTAAEVFLDQIGEKTASSLLRHFIYGNAEPRNIKNEYSAFLAQRSPNTAAQFTEFLVNANEAQSALKNMPNNPTGIAFTTTVSGELFSELKKGGNPKNFKAQSIVEIPNDLPVTKPIANYDAGSDMTNSLHNYTIISEGSVTSVREINDIHDLPDLPKGTKLQTQTNYPYTLVELAPGATVSIHDIYRFSPNQDDKTKDFLAVKFDTNDVLKFLGPKLLGEDKFKDLYGSLSKDQISSLSQSEYTFNHHRAGRLMVQKGYAKDFVVKASIATNTPLFIPLFPNNLNLT